ncbi:matrix metalloproteinase-9 isoform X2 [Lepeophtheirus salmonis]|uniref:matrix metalloproteinase-9 isoform X2 n=1 Tax=Lepeophtheirus salmonis TaxID=72036 RepID=UPI003AF35948
MTSTLLFKLYNFLAFSFPLVQGSCLSVSSEHCIFPFLSNDGKNLFYECDQDRKCAIEVEPNSRKAIKYSSCSDGCFDNSTVSYCRSTNPDGQSCKFPFKYGGLTHHQCTTMGRSESWCMLNDGITFAYCDRDCPGYEPAEDLMDTCKTTEGQICQFPFSYGSIIYHGCTLDGHDYPWCPTVVNGIGEPEFFGNCTYHCEGFAEEVGRCRSVYGTACIFPFEYKGTVYNECTEIDHVWKWCSVFNLPNGTMRNWGECLGKTCEPIAIIFWNFYRHLGVYVESRNCIYLFDEYISSLGNEINSYTTLNFIYVKVDGTIFLDHLIGMICKYYL